MEQQDLDFKEIDVFHFDEENVNFNDIAQQGDFTYWLASQYMHMLGYESYASFKKAINKAMTTCMTLDIDVLENFEQVRGIVDGKHPLTQHRQRHRDKGHSSLFFPSSQSIDGETTTYVVLK